MPIDRVFSYQAASLPPLPPQAARVVEDVESGRILGASRTVRLLNEVLVMLADHLTGLPATAGADQIRQWANYLIATRGSLSPAVGNALRLTFTGMEAAAQDGSLDDLRRLVRQRAESYNQRSAENVERIARFGANLLAAGQQVMAYDYSSSVNAVLRAAAESGKRLHVVIPESRSLDGGRPILREVLAWGHTANFTVDMAMGHEMQSCSAVFVGVESLSAEGGFWTTVGTRTAAILAAYYGIPFYVPTELLKFDLRSVEGLARETRRVQLPMLNTHGLDGDVQSECDDLEYTPRELITAYITEQGLLPPEAAVQAARALFERAGDAGAKR